MKYLLELLVVLVLSSALLIVSLFDVLADLLGSVPLLLLQKRVVFLDDLLFQSKRNLGGFTHQEGRCFLLHHLVEAKLVNIYQTTPRLEAALNASKCFCHDH